MFYLKQNVIWHGYAARIIGKTYGEGRLYAIELERGGRYADIPERQLEPVNNVVALEDHQGRQESRALVVSQAV